MAKTLEYARLYKSKGYSVIPLCSKGKKPPKDFSWTEFQKRPPRDDELVKWFGNGSQYNIGIVTGGLSGVDIVDLDGEEAVRYSKDNNFAETPLVKTGKGFHRYHLHKDGMRNFQGREGLPNIDLRGEGGFAVAPPSIHPDGHCYEWVEGMGLDDLPLAELPESIVAEAKKKANKKSIQKLSKGVREGGRNGTLATLVGVWLNAGTTPKNCLIQAMAWNTQNKPQMEEQEVIGVVSSIINIHEQEKPNTIFHYTDTGNAERIVAQYGETIRYCYPWKKWVVYNIDGGFWAIDNNGEIIKLAKKVVKKIYKEATTLSDSSERIKLAKWAMKSEANHSLRAMVEVAQSEEGISVDPEELDTNLWLLNCKNGTLDLQTGKLREHNKKDFITKTLPVEYDPDATCPTWISFLNRIMDGNQKLISFLQRALGYSLTGITREQCLFLLHGTGANGKSTFLNTISFLLDDYAQTASFDSFILKRNNSNSNDLARMRGKRFISAIEAEGEKRLAEVLIKQLTGGDVITARFLFSEFFEFKPQLKLWLAANHKPVIKGTDHAIWRRIHTIPFNVTIPESEQDDTLDEKLKAELSGILAWMVQGCLEWQRIGLQPPDEVKAATNDYRNEMDDIGTFLEECCILVPSVKVAKADLYDAYKKWCEENGETPLTQKKFGGRLTERGVSEGRTNVKRFWCNIGLVNDCDALVTGDTS